MDVVGSPCRDGSRGQLNGGSHLGSLVANGHSGIDAHDDDSCQKATVAGQAPGDHKPSQSGSPKHSPASAKQRQPLLPTKLVLPRQRTFDKDSREGGTDAGGAAAAAKPSSAAAVLSPGADSNGGGAELAAAGAAAPTGDPLGARLVGRRLIPRYVGRSRSVTAPASAAAAVRDSSADRSSPASHKPHSAPVPEPQDRMSRSSEARGGGSHSARTRRNSEHLSSLTASTEHLRALALRPATPSMSLRLDLSRIQSKCGSMSNIGHTPRGGSVQIVSRKLEWKAESKVGSLENSRHTPRGGDKKIETVKLEWKADSKIHSFDNIDHKPSGGDKKILSRKLHWEADARVGSMENVKHKPGGGDKKIEVLPVQWEVQARVGSLENARHQPGGGTVKVESHKLNFRENATPKTDSGLSSRKSVGGSVTESMAGSMTGSVAGSLSGSDEHKPADVLDEPSA